MNRRFLVVLLGISCVLFALSKTISAKQSESSLASPSSVVSLADSSESSNTDAVTIEGPSLGQTLFEFRQRQAKMIEVIKRTRPCVVALEGGTGVIVSADGLVLTASHVVKRARRNMEVRLSNGVVWPAETLGCNENTDTGMVQLIGYDAWPYVEISDGKGQPGQWVVGLGYPLSFKRGASAPARVGRILKRSGDRLVTDCLIMGGDSGGPVFDLNGDLLAISSRIKKGIHENYHVHVSRFVKEWKDLADGEVVSKSVNGNALGQPKSKVEIDALTNSQRAKSVGRDSDTLLPFWNSVAASARASLIEIPTVRQGTKQGAVLCGTIVSPDGLAVAKRSLVLPLIKAGKLHVNYRGTPCFARPIGHDARNDLILLELTPKNREGEPVSFNAVPFPISTRVRNGIIGNAKLRPSGNLLVSVSLDRVDPGGVSIEQATFLEDRRRRRIDFGMIIDGTRNVDMVDGNRKRISRRAIEVIRVYPDSLAARSGIKMGDWLIQVDGESMVSQTDLAGLADRTAAGKKVGVLMMRGDQLLTTNIRIPSEKSLPTIFDRWGGGPFSQKRFGFVNVIAHDGVISPEACGGPLVDLEGEVIGINISRATRVSSYAIPIEQVRRMVKRFRPYARIRIKKVNESTD